MKAKEIYDAIMKSVPDVKVYETKIGKIVDAKKYNAFIDRISLEEQIWNRCKPDKELANEVYSLFEQHSLTTNEPDTTESRNEYSEALGGGAGYFRGRLNNNHPPRRIFFAFFYAYYCKTYGAIVYLDHG